MKHISSKYILTLLLTLGIFATAWFVSNTLNAKKFADLKAVQDKISIDILSSETEFDLLTENTCDASSISTFSNDLAVLAEKITYSEQNVATPEEINTLKKQYTLLEVRDFLLTKRIAERCNQKPIAIFYFYGTSVDCPDCVKQGYVLDALRQRNPKVRVYAFDYNLDLSTIKALISIYKVGTTVPALVVNGTTYQGFRSLDELTSIVAK